MLRNCLLAVCRKCLAMSSNMPGCSARIRSTLSTLSSQRLQDVEALYEARRASGQFTQGYVMRPTELPMSRCMDCICRHRLGYHTQV